MHGTCAMAIAFFPYWKPEKLARVLPVKFDDKGSNVGGAGGGNRSKYPSTPSALLASHGERKIRCVYCDEYHFSASCQKVKNVTQRKDILRNNRRFVCLQREHRASDCERRNNCRKCHGSHPQCICRAETHSQPSQDNDTRHTSETKYPRSGCGQRKSTCEPRRNIEYNYQHSIYQQNPSFATDSNGACMHSTTTNQEESR